MGGFYDMRIDIVGANARPLSSRSPQQVTERLDQLIAEIKAVIEGNSASWPGGQITSHRGQHAQDIVCVAHGHILAALAIRWVGLPLDTGMMRLIFEPGGVAVLGWVFIFSVSFVLLCCCGRGLTDIDCLSCGRFEHDNFNQPAIVVGRKPGRSDRTL
jgi:probable phosphoglycerate mutase